jgi:hypothetical protein
MSKKTISPKPSDKKDDPSSRPQRSGEQFDVNQATVSGEISKIWGRGGDVYARLRVPGKTEGQENFVNLRFPDGTVQGRDVDLQPGDRIQVSGYLTHAEFFESIRKFLDAAGEEKTFFDSVPPDDLAAWQAVQFRRVNATLNVLALVALKEGKKPVNRTVVEGIVARQWDLGESDHCVRLAIYDERTPVMKQDGNFGRPRRKPHYVNVILPEGKTTGGREVTLRLKDRIRVTASLTSQGYRLTLHEALVWTGRSDIVELMQRLPNAERLQQISAQQESLSLEAAAIILYASAASRRRAAQSDAEAEKAAEE